MLVDLAPIPRDRTQEQLLREPEGWPQVQIIPQLAPSEVLGKGVESWEAQR